MGAKSAIATTSYLSRCSCWSIPTAHTQTMPGIVSQGFRMTMSWKKTRRMKIHWMSFFVGVVSIWMPIG